MISAENSKQKSIAPPTHSWHAARLLNTIFGGEGELGVVITTVLLTGKQVPNLPVSILCVLSPVQLFVAPWTVAHQAPLLMEFSRQEYWSGLLFPAPRDLPGSLTQGSNLHLLHWQADSLPLSHPGSPIIWALLSNHTHLQSLADPSTLILNIIIHPHSTYNE